MGAEHPINSCLTALPAEGEIQCSVPGEMLKQGAGGAGDKSFVSPGGISLWKCPRMGRGSCSVLTLELEPWLWWDVGIKGYRDGGIGG